MLNDVFNVLWIVVDLCHNFLIFQLIFIKFSLFCLKMFTLSSEMINQVKPVPEFPFKVKKKIKSSLHNVKRCL